MNHPGMWGLTRASLFVMSFSLLTVGAAEAQPRANSAAAEALFEQARSLMNQGNYARACPKLAESQRLDPGLGTLLNLGVCYEKSGRTASAWATFKDARTMARKQGEPERVKFAEQHISKLTPVLSRLEVSVAASEEQAGLKVLVDGMPLGRPSWGVALPMDPGAHEVQATAPGHQSWKSTVVVGKREDNKRVVVPRLVEASSSEAAVVAKPEHSEPTSAQKPETVAGHGAAQQNPTGDQSNAQVADSAGGSTWGYVIGGAGLVALGVGGYYGARAMSRYDERQGHCNDTGICDQSGADAVNDANTYGWISNAGVGLGLVGVGVGAYMLLSGSTSEAPTQAKHVELFPHVGENSAGLSVGGSW